MEDPTEMDWRYDEEQHCFGVKKVSLRKRAVRNLPRRACRGETTQIGCRYDEDHRCFRIREVPVRKLVVRNLSRRVASPVWLRREFQRYGAITGAFVDIVQRELVGCVTFETPSEAAKALISYSKYDDGKVIVSAAEEWDQPNDCDSDQSESMGSKLNEDCLTSIFSYLDIVDRVAVGLVCKRWRWASLDLWKRQKELDFTQDPIRERLHSSYALKNTLNLYVPPFFARLCPNITKIVLEIEGSVDILIAIGESCPLLEQLTVLHTCGRQCQLECLADFGTKCPRLKSFVFTNSSSRRRECRTEFINRMLSSGPALENMSISGDLVESNWLRSVIKPLKSLRLTHCHIKSIMGSLLEYLEKYGEYLTSFTLATTKGDSLRLSSPELGRILSLTPNLNELILEGIEHKYNHRNRNIIVVDVDVTGSLYQITRLTNLRRLSLANNTVEVSDNLLRDVARRCRMISHLDVSRTHLRLLSIANFRNLVSLNISYMRWNWVKLSSGLSLCLERLIELTVRNVGLNDQECCEILRHTKSLEYLDISMNREVTNVSFDYLCAALRNDSSRPHLDFVLQYVTLITKAPELDISERLTLHRSEVLIDDRLVLPFGRYPQIAV